MDQNNYLLTDSPNVVRPFEKTTPFPAAHGFYRSRIYTADISLNPLIAACDQLFGLATTLKTTEYPNDSNKFLQDLAHEIRSFEHRAQVSNYPTNIIVAARYAICSLLDETIGETPWGQTNKWHEKNLLSLFHNENYGGTRFFSIIDRSLENIADNLHLIELLYLCLNFGFTGKYKEIANGQNELVVITNKLYQIIGQYGSGNHKNILIHDEKLQPQQSQVIPTSTTNSATTVIDTKKLFLLAISFALTISGLIYLGINLKLNHLSKPIYSAIEQLTENKGKEHT